MGLLELYGLIKRHITCNYISNILMELDIFIYVNAIIIIFHKHFFNENYVT